MNKMRPVAKRDTWYTLSLFGLKYAFEIKVDIKIKKTCVENFFQSLLD